MNRFFRSKKIRQATMALILSGVLLSSVTVEAVTQASKAPRTMLLADLFKKPSDDLGIDIYYQDESAEASANKLSSVLFCLKDNYYRELSSSELFEAMAKGVVNSMDSKYTYYLEPEEHQVIEEEMSGEYVGIGCTVRLIEGVGFELSEPIENSPAEQAGLLDGDVVLKVDGEDVSELKNANELARRVRGEAGTTVELEIYRPSEKKTLSFKIERRKVEAIQVKSRMLDTKTAVIEIREFTMTLFPQFKAEMEKVLRAGARQIVFDMRNNPGGEAETLQNCLDLLLDEGPICAVYGRRDGEAYVEKWRTHDGKLSEDLRYAVLVNKNTASAAELFTGCLRDRLNVPVIGEQTYGKGSGTISYTLDDQSAVNITIFRYFLPKAECIEGLGLVPTIPAELPEETHTKALRDLTEDEDTQLQEALKYFAKGEKQSDDPSEIEPENPIGASDGDDEADGSVSAAPSASEAKDLSELFAQYAGGQLGYLYNHLSQFFWI